MLRLGGSLLMGCEPESRWVMNDSETYLLGRSKSVAYIVAEL